jgi:hypothetical protein
LRSKDILFGGKLLVNNLDPGYVWSFMSMLVLIFSMPVVVVVFYYLRNRFKKDYYWVVISLIIILIMFIISLGISSWFSMEYHLSTSEKLIKTLIEIWTEILRFIIFGLIMAGVYVFSRKKENNEP